MYVSYTTDGRVLTLIHQAVGDDISFIQSQNRGLQVQTQNQRALLAELEQLLVGLSFRNS